MRLPEGKVYYPTNLRLDGIEHRMHRNTEFHSRSDSHVRQRISAFLHEVASHVLDCGDRSRGKLFLPRVEPTLPQKACLSPPQQFVPADVLAALLHPIHTAGVQRSTAELEILGQLEPSENAFEGLPSIAQEIFITDFVVSSSEDSDLTSECHIGTPAQRIVNDVCRRPVRSP